ncbi:MAG: hypothetical protein ACRC1F_02395 [Metamycoplasmataceae bacterium]
MTFKKTVLLSFLKIFFLFFFSMLPIAIHSVLPLFFREFNFEGINGSLVAEAINYSQPMLFFSINIIVLINVQVSFIIKSSRGKENFEENKKKIINTGMYVSFFLSFLISILFIVIMMLYSEFSISDVGNKSEFLKSYSEIYIGIMSVYILFIGISSYFIFMTLESGIKLQYILMIEVLFSFLDILLAAIFLINLMNISPVIRISMGTLISTIIKFITMSIIFKAKVARWKISEMRFNWLFAKDIAKMSWMLSTFMLVYSFNVILQMTFINLISREVHSYLFFENGESLIILSRIIIFSILNLLVIVPKSIGRAVNLSSTKPIKGNLTSSLDQFRVSNKYNVYGTAFFLAASFIIYIFISNIVDSLFLEQTWTKEIIPLENQSSIPFPHNPNITYLEVIKKFVLDGFLISIFAQATINFGINLRIFTNFNFGGSIYLFSSIIFSFVLSYGLGSYFLGVHLQSFLPGMIGFSLTQLIYGVMSISLTTFYYFRILGKLLNENLENLSEEKLEKFWSHKNIFKYLSDRKTKIRVCSFLNDKDKLKS